MDRLSQITERAIRIADVAKDSAPHERIQVHGFLIRILMEMRQHAPDHPAQLRLESYLNGYLAAALH